MIDEIILNKILNLHLPILRFPVTVLLIEREDAFIYNKANDNSRWQEIRAKSISLKGFWEKFLEENALFKEVINDSGISFERAFEIFCNSFTPSFKFEEDLLIFYPLDKDTAKYLFEEDFKEYSKYFNDAEAIFTLGFANSEVIYSLLRDIRGGRNVIKVDMEEIDKVRVEEESQGMEVGREEEKKNLGRVIEIYPESITYTKSEGEEGKWGKFNIRNLSESNFIIKIEPPTELKVNIARDNFIITPNEVVTVYFLIDLKDIRDSKVDVIKISVYKGSEYLGSIEFLLYIYYEKVKMEEEEIPERVQKEAIEGKEEVKKPGLIHEKPSFSSRRKKYFLVSVLFLILLSGLILTLNSWNYRFWRLVKKGDLVTPIGKSAYDIYLKKFVKEGMSKKINKINSQIKKILLGEGDKIFEKIYQEGIANPDDIIKLERVYEWFYKYINHDNEIRARWLFAKARSAIENKKYSEAQDLLREAMGYTTNKKTLAMTWNALGITYIRKNLYTFAADCYKKAIEYDPYWIAPLINLGVTYMAQEKLNSAISTLKRAEKIDPNRVSIKFYLGECYRAKGLIQVSCNYYRNALQLISKGYPSYVDKNLIKKRINKYCNDL